MHAFKNDFPDWDREDWAVFVPPLIPSYLVSTIVVLIVVLVGTIVYAVRRRQQSHSGRSGGYSAIDWRDRASSWL